MGWLERGEARNPWFLGKMVFLCTQLTPLPLGEVQWLLWLVNWGRRVRHMLLRLVLFPHETMIVCHMEICSSLSQSTCLGLQAGFSRFTFISNIISNILRPFLHSLFYFAIYPEPKWGRRYCVLGTQWGADHGGPGLLCLRVWNYVDQRVSITMSTGWEDPQKAAVNESGY